MPNVRFSKKTRSSSSRRIRRVRRSAPRKDPVVHKSQLYRAIRRQNETKMSSTTYGYTGFNSGITLAGDLITVLPIVQQGIGQNQRIGSKIKPLKLVIRGYINYYAPTATTNIDARMLGARLFCFQDKGIRSYASATANNYNLLDPGGAPLTFSGSLDRYMLPTNKDQFIFYCDKKMRVLKPFGGTNNVTPTTANAMGEMNNTLYHPFVITISQKKLPAVFNFDETSSPNFPTNFAPLIASGYCDLFNHTADTVTTQLGLQFTTTLYYEDA